MNLDKTNEEWHLSSFAVQYFEKLREQLKDSDQTLIEQIQFRSNYGFILNTREILTEHDKLELIAHILRQLKSIGYIIAKTEPIKLHLAASARKKVSGDQLFGSVKIVNKLDSIHLLVTPFIDHQYKNTLEVEELIHLVFS